jgi:hypothetical protein
MPEVDDLKNLPLARKRPPGFALGNYWIVSSYLMAAFTLPFTIIATIVAQAAEGSAFGPGMLAASLLCSLLAITMLASAWGMQMRIIYGVYFAYVFLATEAVLGLGLALYAVLSFSPNEPVYFFYIKLSFAAYLTLSALLWWRYFWGRHDLFE